MIYVEITPYVRVEQGLNLAKIHTRELLRLLRLSYVTCTECDGFCGAVTKKQYDNLHKWQYKLRKELSTREHIPNKVESRALRIARKKSGISRKK